MCGGARWKDYVALPDGESVHEALVLAEHLAARPDSHFSAELSGGQQFLGWGHEQQIAADTRDLLLALIAGLGGKSLGPDDLYPRPQAVAPVEEVGTVAEFDVAAFMRRLAGS
jgi:hypothetical protein